MQPQSRVRRLTTRSPMLFRRMGGTREHSETTKGGRFDRGRIADRLEEARGLAGLGQKEVGSAVWPNQKPENARSGWNKLMNERKRDLSLGEIEAAVDLIAEALGAHPKHPEFHGTKLPGFPFIDLYASRRIETGREIHGPPAGSSR